MRPLEPWKKPLPALLSSKGYTATQLLLAEGLGRPIVRFRENPNLTLIMLSGMINPPHQRLMTNQIWQGAPENVNVSSRGTAKSTTICVFDAALIGMLYSKKRILDVAATGFRGGQRLFTDFERWALGQLDGQLPDHPFIADSMARTGDKGAIIRRAQNYWEFVFESGTVVRTLPTTDESKILGERAHIAIIDEANLASDTLISKIIRPFLAVKGGFETGGVGAANNMAIYCLTVDFSWRPFIKTVLASRESIRRDYEAHKAARRGDWAAYEDFAAQGLLKYTYTSFDYSDTLIRERIRTRDGRVMKVTWPNAQVLSGRVPLEFREFREGVPFTTRDPQGHIQRDSGPIVGLTTYPIEKGQIEGGLFDGSVVESMWLSENKNVIDSAAGDVYAHSVVDRAACRAPNVILPWDECGLDWQTKHHEDPTFGYASPLMYECDDPCVAGIDVAFSARDFAAFCVIRVGPGSTGAFNPLGTRSLGYTPWSNVVWMEQHRAMSPKDIADKIRQLNQRYNMSWYREPWKDDWEWCRAIGIDDRGGGASVRDELAFLDKVEGQLPPGAVRMYDPLDKDPKVTFVKEDPNALPMLDMIAAQDTTNDRLVEFTLGQMKVNKLFVPKWLDESQRPNRDAKYNPGYLGAAVLEHQLRRLQQEPTARARRFFMPGDSLDVKNKKDAWASYIYAAKQLRAHLLRLQVIQNRPPAMGGGVSRVNSQRGRNGRSPGAKL